jgi:phosphoglycolate phosphatase-like HAD superfamily hydrolase
MNGNAIIWDYDGTLVDSRHKNLNVNRQIIQYVTGKDPDIFPLLRSQRQFEAADSRSPNWRDLYRLDFGLSEVETEEAGRLWTEYQLKDRTPVLLFDGIKQVIAGLADMPQGVLSQNSRAMIETTLAEANLVHHFGAVVGYEEVPAEQQKPDPAGLLICLEQLTRLQPGVIFYIGDWQTDAIQAVNSRAALKEKGVGIEVVFIGAFWAHSAGDGDWTTRPDYRAQRPEEIIHIVRDRLGR